MSRSRKEWVRGIAGTRWLLVASVVIVAVLIVALRWKPTEPTPPRHLVVLCAAGLRVPLEQISAEYEKLYNVRIDARYGPTEGLYSQLRVTQDGDLFLAADAMFIEKARDEGLAREALPVATQTPVIAVAKGNPKHIQKLDDLLRADVNVAIARPEAAVGKLTRELFQAAGKWEALEAAVTAHGSAHTTVVEVANAVRTGTRADAGIVWVATVAQTPDQLEAVRVPELEAGKSQAVLSVLASAKDPTAALRFARYVTARDKGLAVFKKAGYNVSGGVGEGDIWEYRPTVTLFSGAVNRVAIDQTVTDFERREGVTVNRIYNGCGILVADMKALRTSASGSAPKGFPDAYMACDVSFVTPVAQWFDPALPISETDMLIATRVGNPHNIRTLADFAEPGLKIGLADPTQSTLGALTQRLLDAQGITEGVRRNLAFSSATADLLAMQLVEGKLDAAVIYRVNATKFTGKIEVLPIAGPDTIAVQPYTVAKGTDHRQLMQRLLEAITSAESKKRFEANGFRWRVGAATPGATPEATSGAPDAPGAGAGAEQP